MLSISKCQYIVRSLVQREMSIQKHLSGKQLVIKNRKYRIQPDDTFISFNKVFVVEYEKNKRPVESISKYWWLLNNTDWLKEDLTLIVLLVGLNMQQKGIRTESIEILGSELENQFPDKFFFYNIPPFEANNEKIEDVTINILNSHFIQ